MARQNRIFGWITAGLLACVSTHAATAAEDRGVQVLGHGSIETEPDLGYVRLHVRREAREAAALKQSLDVVVADVLRLLEELGVRARDVTATAVSLSPRYRRADDANVVDGLIGTRTIAVTLRDLDGFAAVLDRALAVGVNNVDPPRLDSSRRAALEDEALELAMADARAEAERVAAGFGVQLGDVVGVKVGVHSPRPEAAGLEMRAAAAPAAAFSAGTIRIERHIEATFAIVAD